MARPGIQVAEAALTPYDQALMITWSPELVELADWILSAFPDLTESELNRDFRFDSPIPTRRVHRTAFLCKGLAGFGSTVFPAAPGGAGFASGGHATPGDALFPNGSADTFPCALASSSKSAPRCARLIPPATIDELRERRRAVFQLAAW
jgi:hypothetical protein